MPERSEWEFFGLGSVHWEGHTLLQCQNESTTKSDRKPFNEINSVRTSQRSNQVATVDIAIGPWAAGKSWWLRGMESKEGVRSLIQTTESNEHVRWRFPEPQTRTRPLEGVLVAQSDWSKRNTYPRVTLADAMSARRRVWLAQFVPSGFLLSGWVGGARLCSLTVEWTFWRDKTELAITAVGASGMPGTTHFALGSLSISASSDTTIFFFLSFPARFFVPLRFRTSCDLARATRHNVDLCKR